MNFRPQRADVPPHHSQEAGGSTAAPQDHSDGQQFDQLRWQESASESELAGAGGRAVLGTALVLLSILWTGFAAWSAGSYLSGQSLSAPAVAQWVAIAAGPLALLGLVWIMFGRTRRKEAERFTRSVIAMRTEARSLEALLGVLSQRISESQSELGNMAQQLMQLGDDTSARLTSTSRELGTQSELVARHAGTLDRAAESARNDIAVLLDDIPRAEASTRSLAEQLRTAGAEAASRAGEFESQVAAISARTREAEEAVTAGTQRLTELVSQIDHASASAAQRVGEAEAGFTGALDQLLERTSATLDQIRGGVEAQAAAVSALVGQASAGIGSAGIEAARALETSVSGATGSLELLSSRIVEQEQASRRMAGEIASALGELDGRFAALAEQGDQRALAFIDTISRARRELEGLGAAAGDHGTTIEDLAGRTQALSQSVEQLSIDLREQLSTSLSKAEEDAARLLETSREARPEIEWMREAAAEASSRISESAAGVAEQQDRFAALLAAIDEGVTSSDARLAELASSIARAQQEAGQLSNETGPALVAAMVQVREAAALAAERAREAIASVVPESAEALSGATREALEQVIRESIEERLREVEATAARAVESARSASDRLTQQMLTLGQSAAALELHVEATNAATREKDSEVFARRVSLLIDSMHSASIDVGKILSDEVDEKAWDSYLRGNRGIFTRRAVRLLDGAEAKAIRAHYEADGEFQQSVNRYIHDFEAMLRRVLAERDGGMIAVTLMSSDMGKLYAALAEAIERRR